MKNDTLDLDLSAFLKYLSQKKTLLLVSFIVPLLLSLILFSFLPKKYTSTLHFELGRTQIFKNPIVQLPQVMDYYSSSLIINELSQAKKIPASFTNNVKINVLKINDSGFFDIRIKSNNPQTASEFAEIIHSHLLSTHKTMFEELIKETQKEVDLTELTLEKINERLNMISLSSQKIQKDYGLKISELSLLTTLENSKQLLLQQKTLAQNLLNNNVTYSTRHLGEPSYIAISEQLSLKSYLVIALFISFAISISILTFTFLNQRV